MRAATAWHALWQPVGCKAMSRCASKSMCGDLACASAFPLGQLKGGSLGRSTCGDALALAAAHPPEPVVADQGVLTHLLGTQSPLAATLPSTTGSCHIASPKLSPIKTHDVSKPKQNPS